jgi:ribosomal protein L2
MPIRSVKPTSPARRYMTFVVNDDITKSTPEKSLLSPKRRSNGRNVYGRITVITGKCFVPLLGWPQPARVLVLIRDGHTLP